MKQVYESLKKHLEETTDEELQKEFDELSEWNDIGPTVKEYLTSCKEWSLYSLTGKAGPERAG